MSEIDFNKYYNILKIQIENLNNQVSDKTINYQNYGYDSEINEHEYFYERKIQTYFQNAKNLIGFTKWLVILLVWVTYVKNYESSRLNKIINSGTQKTQNVLFILSVFLIVMFIYFFIDAVIDPLTFDTEKLELNDTEKTKKQELEN